MSAPPKPRFDRALLADRLQLALEAPHRATSWHWLREAADAATEADRADLLEAVRRRRPAGGPAAMLAASFLDNFAADESELALASQAYLGCELPLDAGLALLNVIYSRGLRSAGSSDRFVALLRRTAFVELSRQLGTRLLRDRGRPAQRPGVRGRLRKVAVVAPTLSTGYHAPTRMAVAHACLLREQQLDARVFAPQEHLMPHMSHWLGTPRQMALQAADRSGWPRPKHGSLPVGLADAGLSMRGRWHSLLNAVDSFDPDVVFFIGPYSPLLWPLQARYPVAALGTNALAPVGPMHLWLAPGADAQPTWSPPLDPPQVQAHTHRLSVTVATAPQSRAQLGLPESGVVWITSGFGLARELTAHWCALVRAALERHPDAHWLLVGKTKDLPAFVPTGHPRVIVAGVHTDFGAVLLACDLYLNPPRLGGGYSVAMAMAHGVPALSLAGTDGGDKLGPDAAPGEAAYFEALDTWTRDAGARRKAGAAQRERFQRRFDLSAAGPMLVNALRRTIQSGSRMPRRK